MTTEELNALIAQAEGGDVAAMNQLGQIFGGNEFKDFEKAFYWHKKAAELGNVNSMSNLGGWCYLQGNGTEKNIPLADEWLKKSVENGWVWTWAFNELANIFANDAQYKDLSKAFYWYSKSAEAGDALGMSNLGGWCYLWGNGTEKDLKLAVDWLEKAAEKDNMWSVCKLACDIYSQDNEFKDIDKALVCIEKIIVKYFAVAQPDYDRALKCLEKLAEEGNPKAICLMPKMIQDPFGGEHPDKWKWIQKAAEVGDAQCQYKMAEKMLSNNEDEAAYKWFAQSAKGGNADAISRLNSLGLDFQNGNNGRKQNQPLAYRFYVAAAECGNADGMANAGYCISNGIGVEKDLKKAFEYYQQAAELGHWLGMSNLGWCYLYGNGIEKDVEKAAHWLTRAAEECNNIWSMNRLTEIYGELEGSINYSQAIKWFRILVQKDNDPQSGVYHNTQYKRDLCEKIVGILEKSISESDAEILLNNESASNIGTSLFAGSAVFGTNQVQEDVREIKRLWKEAEEMAEKEKREQEERQRREQEAKERQAREMREKFENDYTSSSKTRWMNELSNGTIIIPDGVTKIGNYAFAECGELESIIIPESVESIGECAFEKCINLCSVKLPNGIRSIEKYAFYYCIKLSSIDIPNTVEKVGVSAFCNCDSLTSIVIPEGVKCIEDGTFEYCENLSSVTLPCSVTSIGDSAFCDCKKLSSLNIPNSVTTIGGHAFACCTNLNTINIPNGITSIKEWTFHACKNLKHIVIPNSVTRIEEGAFRVTGLATITIPDSVTNIGKEAFTECNNLTSVTIGNGVKIIEEGAFKECQSLRAIRVPDSVTCIQQYAFQNCKNLSTAVIGNGVTSIERWAFWACKNLRDVVLGNSLEMIGEEVFEFCTSLTSIKLPDSILSMDRNVFSQCTNLTRVIVPMYEKQRFEGMIGKNYLNIRIVEE